MFAFLCGFLGHKPSVKRVVDAGNGRVWILGVGRCRRCRRTFADEDECVDCPDCGEPCIAADDDAMVCCNCGGQNRPAVVQVMVPDKEEEDEQCEKN